VNYKILSLHKCATNLQENLFRYLAQQLNFNFYSNKNVKRQDRIYPYIITNRTIYSALNSIIIPRHPLNRLISQYYSFGWTHDTTFEWVKNENQKNIRKIDFLSKRYKIQNQTLDEYVKENIEDRVEEYKILLTTNELVIPYEFMMEKPYEFLSIICNKFERPDLIDSMYNIFKEEFKYNVVDKSESIVRHKSKAHKRTLNKNEYIEKLKPDTLKFAKEKINNILEYYNTLLNNYKII